MNNLKSPSFISVSQLNFYIKSLMDSDDNLRYVFVTGEISNLTDHYSSGHIYLTLKDEKASVKAVMFSYSARNLRFKPQNGMKIIARGKVTVYEPSGQYQLYIEDMQPDGVGALTIAYEQLKKKLDEEELFDPKYKKPIPKFPRIISVITSPTGAALQDIRNILARRWPYSEVRVTPVLVQGESAPKVLTDAIKRVDAEGECDVIIIGRGGGSIEDLWAFNSEELARAIFECKIPVVSAVGHETDFTICDFVSDLRAPTPSAAAELVTPNRFSEIDNLLRQRQYLFVLSDKLLSSQKNILSEFAEVLKNSDPRIEYEAKRVEFNNLSERLSLISKQLSKDSLTELNSLRQRLFSVNPSEILARGYTVTSKDGKTVLSADDLSEGDKINIRFIDGTVGATVI